MVRALGVTPMAVLRALARGGGYLRACGLDAYGVARPLQIQAGCHQLPSSPLCNPAISTTRNDAGVAEGWATAPAGEGHRTMGAFTPEQATLLASLLEAIIAGLTKTNVRLAAIQKVLVQKGTITVEEFHEAMKETEAGMAVEKVFRPELDDISRKLRTLLEGAQ